nr:hypothetical protein CQNTEFLM_CQNTEFLM_CDS_0007 [uncultured phage]
MAATDVLAGGAPSPTGSPMAGLDSTTKAYDVLHSVPILGGLSKFLGFNDPNSDMKKQWAYDSNKMQYEANLKDWLTKNSGQYNFNMAKS